VAYRGFGQEDIEDRMRRLQIKQKLMFRHWPGINFSSASEGKLLRVEIMS
jgi:hypothetical protein